jgi:ABC-type oligopeptide transport system ATPase subunit
MGKFGHKVQIDLNPLSYNLCLLGESGIGKSTLAKQVCEKLVGDGGYLSLDIGKEDGHKAISGIVSEKCDTWSKYMEVIDDIAENKFTDYPELKVVIVDTFDQLCDLAEKEAVKLWNAKLRQQGKPQIDTINSAFGGFGKGLDKTIDLMLDSFWKLKEVGVSVFIIAHIKRTDITDVMTEESYTMLTASTTQRYFNAIKQKLDVIGMAYIDRNIVKRETGKKDINGNVISKNFVSGESRVINFRDDTYSVDSKSRFANIVGQISFDADEFIKAIKDAILNEQSKDGVALEDAQKAQAEKEKIKEEKAKAASEQIKEEKAEAEAEESREDILAEIQKRFIAATKERKERVKELIKEAGYEKLSDPEIPILTLIKIKEIL